MYYLSQSGRHKKTRVNLDDLSRISELDPSGLNKQLTALADEFVYGFKTDVQVHRRAPSYLVLSGDSLANDLILALFSSVSSLPLIRLTGDNQPRWADSPDGFIIYALPFAAFANSAARR